MKQITLDPTEFWTAVQVGCIRQYQNLKKGRRDAHGASKDKGWSMHIEGACGEAAVAKFLNVYYTGNIGRLAASDVNHRDFLVEVRTSHGHNNRLILHPSDPDEGLFIFVVGRAPNLTLKGWIKAKDGKQKENWSDPAGGRPAFFVPQSALHPMSTFPGYVGELEAA